MAVTIDDVRHVAALARLGISDERAASIVGELNTILAHMDVLLQVKTDGIDPVTGIGTSGTPLRADKGPPIPLERSIDAFAPRFQDGFFLVPRLSTHEEPESSS